MSRPWLTDMTLKPQDPPSIEALPDGSVEIAWERDEPGEKVAITLILRPEHFNRIVEVGRELQLLGRITTSDVG